MRKLRLQLKTLMLIVAFIWPMISVMGQTKIWEHSFETAGSYTTSVAEFSDGSGDYFTRTNGSDIAGTFTSIQGAYFFAGQDLDGEGATLPLTLTFEDVNIAGYTNLELRVFLAEDDDGTNQDWDAPDYVHFDLLFNNGEAYENALWIENDGTATNAAPLIDTDFDGTGDGAEITEAFTQYTASINGTGSVVDIIVEMNLDSGDEDIAFDQIELWGTAGTPVTPTKLAITSVTPTSPIINTPFDVVVEAQDATGIAGNVDQDTEVRIALNSGTETGTITGTYTGTISVDESSVTISGLLYNVAEDIEIQATVNTGMGLTASSNYTVTVSPVPTIPDVFISEYIEGSGNNKAIEIYNGTGSDVDMENFRVAYASGGGDWSLWQTFATSTIVANEDVYVIAADQADAAILAAADEAYAYPSVCHYSGNDAIALEYTEDGGTTWTIIDIIGDPNTDPGTAWEVAGVANATAEYTLVRKFPGVTTGNTDWTASAGTDATDSEWIVNPQDDFSFIGWHGVEPVAPEIANIAITPEFATLTDAVTVTADITVSEGSINTVELNYGVESGTYTSTVNMTNTTDDEYTGEIPAMADGTTVYYQIVATDVAGTSTNSLEQSYTVSAEPTQVADIATLRAGATDGTVYELTGEAILTYQQSFRSKKYIQDGTGGIEIDDPNGNITTTYNIYDGITGIQGTLSEYGGILQFVPVADPGTATSSGNTITPQVVTIGDINGDGNAYEAQLVTLENVTFADAGGTFETGTVYSISDASKGTIDFVTNFHDASYIGTTIPSGAQNINVIVFEDGGTSEVTAREATDIVAIVSPEITNITATPTAPMSTDIVTVTADVNDADGTISSVELNYGVASGTYTGTITMNTAKGTYTGEIPAMTDGTTVYYQIAATDNEGNTTLSDEQSYTVVNEAIALEISATDPTEPYIGQEFTVTVNALDVNGTVSPVSEDTEILLELTTGNGAISGTYTGTISMDQSSVTIGDLTYDMAEAITITASTTSGMTLTNSEAYALTITEVPAEPVVFFSEYSEAASGNTKYVEVYNATGEEIDLTGIVVKLASNGGDWGNTHELTGTLADGDVYVIANAGSAQEILDVTDATSSITYFNGNDAVGLFVNDVLVDAIGVQGVDPGDGWDVAGITEATKDHTLVRKYGEVTVGNTDWTISAGMDATDSEWIVLDWDNYTNAGWHGEPITTPIITNVAIAPVNPTPEDIVTVSATVTDSDATLTSVELQYGFTAGTYTSTVTMTNEVDNDYIAEIPAQVLGTTVYFVIAAEDENGVVLSEEQSYEVTEALSGLADIATLRQGAADGTVYTLAGEAILTFQQSNRNQKYIQDATGGILIDDNSGNITTTYNRYDGITGITGTLSVYNGLLQFIPTADPGAATSTDNVITPEIATIDAINTGVADYESELITLEGVTFEEAGSTFSGGSNLTLSDGTNTITFRTNFYDADYIGEAIPAGPQNITALVGQYNGTAQVTAREFADMVSTHPVIANIAATPVEPSSTDVVTVTADVTDGNGTISSVNLNWGTATGELTNTEVMTASGDTYTAEISAQADGTVVYYSITATDNDGNPAASDEMSYEVIDYNVATQLSISAVSPASPFVNQVFSVEVTALDADGAAGTVSEDTEVQINLADGTSELGGTVTGTILNGTTSVTISGIVYDVAETIMVNASTVSGMSLTASTDFEVVVAELPDVPLVFISEYIEGSSNNKAIEIYNGTGSELDLTGYSVQKSSNGDGEWGSEEVLTGTVAAGDVFVIANSQADPAILDVADVTSTVTFYNGNDAVGLFYNGELIDVIGVPSEDVIWDVAGVTEAAQNHTLTRKYPDVIMGNTDWATSAGTNADDSEWIVSDIDDFSGIGWHGVPPVDPVITNITATPEMPTSEDAVTVSATVTSPAGTIATVTLDWGTASGDLSNTVAMTADADTYSVEIPAQADGTSVYFTITAEDTEANVTVSNENNYMVSDPSIVSLPYSEDYTDNTFGELRTFSVVGDDQVWEVANYGNPAPGAKVTGYAGENYENEDWMITPGLDFSEVTEAKMVFDEAINFATDVNSEMPIMVSTDYTGSGDPTTATWTELTVTGRSTGDGWDFVTVNEVDLTAYAGEAAIYIGFKYTSTTEDGATWEVDNILVEEGAALVAPVIEDITLSPAQPTPDDAVTVSATIIDGDGTIETAILHWGTDVFFGNTIDMSLESGDTWVSNEAIPAQASETQVFYKIVATDNDANSTSTDNLFYFSFQPFTGELPYFEPFYYGLGTMSDTSVTGEQTWRWDDYGYAKVSGYAGSNYENEDWLITPELDFSTVESTVVLNFREAINYAGTIVDEQEVMISTDYDGSDVASATWTKLEVTGRAAGDSWSFVDVDEVDLTDYVGETSVHIAFKYTSTTEVGATWEVDEVSVSEDDAIIFGATKEMSIYPNPAQNTIFMNGVSTNTMVHIFDVNGKAVLNSENTNNTIDVSELNDGLYIIRVIDGSDVYTTRFIKE